MNKRGLLALLLRCLRLWNWSFLLLGWLVELVSYEDNSVVLNAVLISPFLWLGVAAFLFPCLCMCHGCCLRRLLCNILGNVGPLVHLIVKSV